MSWLRNHFRHFVLPGIHTLARQQGQSKEWGATASSGLTVADIKPRDKLIRPSSKCKFVEAGLLYSLVSSVLRKGNPTREIALGLCRQIGRAKDAEFVYAIDAKGSVKSLGAAYDGVEGSDVLHSMLCNSMRRLKRQMRRRGSLLLPGRDVWCWEVMAQKLSVQSTFDARVSRSVAGNQKALRVCIDDWKVQSWDDVLFFDTGFSGTIPRAIARAEKLDEINMLLLSSANTKVQIFRTHTGSRAKALAFEYLAKYFVSGTTRDNQPYQELNPLDAFIKAALLTIWLWHHVSPTKLPSYRDKKLPKLTSAQKQAQIAAHYAKTKINPANFGTLSIANDMFVPATTGLHPLVINADATSVTGGNWSITTDWASTSTAATTLNYAGATLDQLWGTGATGQILLDASPPPKTMFEHLSAEMAKEVDKEIINKLLVQADGNPDKIPPDKIPPSMMFETVSVGPPKKHFSKKLTPILNPETFTLHDPATGVNKEVAEDIKLLQKMGYKPLGDSPPTEEGFEMGQYPGLPIVNTQMLKTLAGMPPDAPGLPEVDLSIELDSDPNIAGGAQIAFKKTTLTTPSGTKKVFKTPITG